MTSKIKKIEQENWVNQNTGEVREVSVITKEVDRRGFKITYFQYLAMALNIIGGKKKDVLNYILENMDANNILYTSQKKLAEKSGVSLKTVNQTIKALKEADLIATKTNIIIVNPKLLHEGNNAKEQGILIKFKQIEKGDL